MNTPKKLYRPISRTVYTMDQILNELKLDDSPCLLFNFPTVKGVEEEMVIQESHNFANLGTLGHLTFRYIRTTHEWIPVFQYVGDVAELVKHLDFKLALDPLGWRSNQEGFGTYAYAKGDDYPRYYELVNGQLVMPGGEIAECKSEEMLQLNIETEERFNTFIKGLTA